MNNSDKIIADYINLVAAMAHANALDKGFWDANRDIGNKCMLIVSELAEFLERYRKDDIAPDEHCPQFTNQTIELADVAIRLFDLAGYLKVPLGAAIVAKMGFNKTRPKLHGKKF